MNLVSNIPIVHCKLLKTWHDLTSHPCKAIRFGLPYGLESPDNLGAYLLTYLLDLRSCLLEIYKFLLPVYCFDYLRPETQVIKLWEIIYTLAL